MTAEEYIANGKRLADDGQLKEAALLFSKAIKAAPAAPEPYQCLGEALVALKYWDEAEQCFGQAIAADATYAPAYNYLGIVYKHSELLDDAEEAYRQAIRLEPGYAEAYHNLGNCLKFAGRYLEAEPMYKQALALQPDLYDTRFSLGTLYFLLGRYAEGWPLYDARFDWRKRYRMDIPLWRGEPLEDKRILLFYEQGFGDMLQFIRYAAKIKDASDRITVWIQPQLSALLSAQKRFMVYSNGRLIDQHEYDYACSIFSLPARFADKTPLAEVPYLEAPAALTADWQKRLSVVPDNQKKVGVVWAGNPRHSDDKHRSIDFAEFRSLFAVRNAAFISLQVGRADSDELAADDVYDFTAELTDFAATAALIANLDLVIAVDTAVAHLAGALGKPTWLLLPYRPDWRWGLSGGDCSWYPSMQLFRQSWGGRWPEVLERVKAALVAEISACT